MPGRFVKVRSYGLFSSNSESFNLAGTPGAEILVAPTSHFYVKSAVMAGNRNPYLQDPTGTNFAIRNSPNFLFEAGYLTGKTYPGEYKFGGVYNGGKFPSPAGIESSGNYLIYGMASQALYRPDAGSNRGLDATIGFDYSPGDVSRENVQITAGANRLWPKWAYPNRAMPAYGSVPLANTITGRVASPAANATRFS